MGSFRTGNSGLKTDHSNVSTAHYVTTVVGATELQKVMSVVRSDMGPDEETSHRCSSETLGQDDEGWDDLEDIQDDRWDIVDDRYFELVD